jgi:hypothetical protein
VTSRREASQPPVIPGYTYVRLLGMGGFADVFLYRQLMPRRQVAVKVLLAASLDDVARARFRAEADIMASLSHHPSIVTVYQADVASDGRPYLVMEYCSRPGLAQRYRAERMGLAEVLRIGIRLASAVETAHRAGVLHRDIKPANVLVTDFGWPALTDFGIAATAGLAVGQMVGMSIPWSPPEMLADEPVGDVRSDVYSLAATIYSLLARRSPFEVPDGSNSAADLISRIERGTLTPTGRGDVPEALQHVLARAMARDPAQRYHSAIALARALQQVEAGLMLPLTPLDLPDETPVQTQPDADAEAGQATRLRPVRTVSPEATDQLAMAAARDAAASQEADAAQDGDAADVDGASAAGPASVGEPDEHADVPESWRQHVAALEAARPEPQRERRSLGGLIAAGVAGAVVLTALVVAVVLAYDQPRAGADATPSATGTAVVTSSAVPAPENLTAAVTEAGVVFTWTNPSPEPGDRYLWGRAEAGRATTLEVIDEPTVTVAPEAPGPVCIEVAIVRSDGRYTTDPVTGCSDR